MIKYLLLTIFLVPVMSTAEDKLPTNSADLAYEVRVPCNEERGAFLAIAELLDDGVIYPVNINTNIADGRYREKQLKQYNMELAKHLRNYCQSISNMKAEIALTSKTVSTTDKNANSSVSGGLK